MLNSKSKIGLITDEGADLPKEIIEKYQISVIPLKIDYGQLKDIPGNIYQKIREAEKTGIRSFIKTSLPSLDDSLSLYKEKLERFEKIICIIFSSKLSGTYNASIQARSFLGKEEQERIFIIDSLNASAGQGLLVIKAADLIAGGKEMQEILEILKTTISRIRSIGMLKDPKWLEASGRLPHFIANWIRKMEKIGLRPVMWLRNGKIRPCAIKRTRTIPLALSREFEKRISRINTTGGQKIRVAISHGDNFEEAMELKEMIERTGRAEIVFVNLICDIFGGHLGPGALILALEEVD